MDPTTGELVTLERSLVDEKELQGVLATSRWTPELKQSATETSSRLSAHLRGICLAAVDL